MSNEEMEPFVFAVVPKKQEKKWRRTLKDLVRQCCGLLFDMIRKYVGAILTRCLSSLLIAPL